jgi:hypothetical protein
MNRLEKEAALEGKETGEGDTGGWPLKEEKDIVIEAFRGVNIGRCEMRGEYYAAAHVQNTSKNPWRVGRSLE